MRTHKFKALVMTRAPSYIKLDARKTNGPQQKPIKSIH